MQIWEKGMCENQQDIVEVDLWSEQKALSKHDGRYQKTWNKRSQNARAKSVQRELNEVERIWEKSLTEDIDMSHDISPESLHTSCVTSVRVSNGGIREQYFD